MPMGLLLNKPSYIPEEELRPYWPSVLQVSGILHLAVGISAVIVWFLYPHLIGE